MKLRGVGKESNMASETVTIVGRVVSRHEATKEGGRRFYFRGQPYGVIDVYDVLGGKLPDGAGGEITCLFGEAMPTWFTRRRWVQIEGVLSDVAAKRRRILHVNGTKSFLVSVKSVENILATKGVDVSRHRKKAVAAGGSRLVDEIEAKAASKEVADLYSQDVAVIVDLLQRSGYEFDIEMGHEIATYFRRRAEIRGYSTPGEMIAENPWLLAELTDFKLADVKRIVKELRPKLGTLVPLYAEIANWVAAAGRQGHSYQSITFIAKRLETLLTAAGYAPQEHTYYLSRMAAYYPKDMPHQAQARLKFSSAAEFGDEAKEYFTHRYELTGIEKSAYWGSRASSGMYFAKTYYSEVDAASIIADLIGKESIPVSNHSLRHLEGLSASQRRAVQNALEYRVSAIIGHAGSGKTHAVGKLLDILAENGCTAVVLAPSAMAAQVAAMKTGGSSYATIHKYARLQTEDEDLGEMASPARGREDAHQVVVVDEAGMCDIMTLSALLHSVKDTPGLHIVFVGDTAQLPSMAPSGWFHQIAAGALEDQGLPVTALPVLENFRSRNGILDFAEKVRSGQIPGGINDGCVQTATLSVQSILDIAQGLIDRGISIRDALFLAPTKAGEYGTDRLNQMLRSVYLESAQRIGDLPLYVGDPVVSRKNDYADRQAGGSPFLSNNRHPERTVDVYNGSRGIIKAFEGNTITVEYCLPEGGLNVPYTLQEIRSWVEVGYCLTVHKAQGSEADHVVFVNSGNLSSRNMIYTAVTRAKERLFLVGSLDGIERPAREPYSKFLFRVRDSIRNKTTPASEPKERSLFKSRR